MVSPVVTREQAGLRPPRSRSFNVTPSGVTFHYGGTPIGGFPWDHSRCATIWAAYQAYHMDHNGWVDIAYNAGVCHHGFIFMGRWWGVRSAANGSDIGNQNSYAVCYMPGAGQPFTDEAKIAMLDARDMARGDGHAGTMTWPHRQWFATDCPGDEILAWINAGCPRPGVPAPPPGPPQPHLSAPQAALVRTPSGLGYWIVSTDGGVFTFGDARFWGSLPGIGVRPNQPIVGMACSPSGGGYWLVSSDGGVYAFGDAGFHGSAAGTPLNAPVTGISATPTGAGYWLGARDGGVFAYGDAPFLGSAA